MILTHYKWLTQKSATRDLFPELFENRAKITLKNPKWLAFPAACSSWITPHHTLTFMIMSTLQIWNIYFSKKENAQQIKKKKNLARTKANGSNDSLNDYHCHETPQQNRYEKWRQQPGRARWWWVIVPGVPRPDGIWWRWRRVDKTAIWGLVVRNVTWRGRVIPIGRCVRVYRRWRGQVIIRGWRGGVIRDLRWCLARETAIGRNARKTSGH